MLDTPTMAHVELLNAGLRSIDVMSDPLAGIHDHYPRVSIWFPRR